MSWLWWFLGGIVVGGVGMFVGLGLYLGSRMWR